MNRTTTKKFYRSSILAFIITLLNFTIIQKSFGMDVIGIEKTQVGKAIRTNDRKALVEHFEIPFAFVNYTERRRKVAQALGYAAQLPVDQSGTTIPYLLGEVKPDYIARPKDLIAQSLANGHTNVLTFCTKQFPAHIDEALIEQVINGNATLTQQLLALGVNPKQVKLSEQKLARILGTPKGIRDGLLAAIDYSLLNYVIVTPPRNAAAIVQVLLDSMPIETYDECTAQSLRQTLRFAAHKLAQQECSAQTVESIKHLAHYLHKHSICLEELLEENDLCQLGPITREKLERIFKVTEHDAFPLICMEEESDTNFAHMLRFVGNVIEDLCEPIDCCVSIVDCCVSASTWTLHWTKVLCKEYYDTQQAYQAKLHQSTQSAADTDHS